MMNAGKYRRQYFMPPVPSMKWAEKEYVEKAPVWCSVDLRDGNQALVVPMSLEEKVAFFNFWSRSALRKLRWAFRRPLKQNTPFCAP